MTQRKTWWSRPPDSNERTSPVGVQSPLGVRSPARAPVQLGLEGKERPLRTKTRRHAAMLRYSRRDMEVLGAVHAHGGVLTTVQIAQKFWPPDVVRKVQGLGVDSDTAEEIVEKYGDATVNRWIDCYRWLASIATLLELPQPARTQKRTAEWLRSLYNEQREAFERMALLARSAVETPANTWVLDRVAKREEIPTLFLSRPLLPSDTVSSACKARLHSLSLQGMIEAWEQPVRLSDGRAQSCWFLTREGRTLLAGWLGVKAASLPFHPAGSYGTLHLGHRLALNDLRIAVESAAERKGYCVTTWIDDNDLKRLLANEKVTLHRKQDDHDVHAEERHAVKVPDGYFVLDLGEGKVRHCFVELDNQTLTLSYAGESTKDFAHKVRTMAAFYRSGRYRRLFPGAGDSMWYLTVTTGSEKRLANLKATTELVMGPGNRAADRYWFALLAEIPTWQESFSTAVFTPIWLRAGKARKWALDE